ncbi:MAG: histidinol-phosphate transaminase [Chloroflexi bacterium]|nr:MAG: histidinol-phosphate transaminase [Chloroflexota bacterium]
MTTSVKPQRGLNAMKPYAPGKPIEEVQREYGLTDVIKLASNENPVGPSPKAVAAIEQALCDLNLYPDSQSYNLRRAIAQRLGFDPEQIAVGNGADGLITQVCLAYLDEDSEAVVSRSSFPVYDRFVHTMRAKLVKTPMRDYRLDLEAMAEAITGRTRLVFVCNPNNPTGTIVTADEVESFMRRVPDHVLVIFDEAYYEYVEAEDYPDSLQYLREGWDNVLTMRTLSKAYGLAGVRLGYAISTPEILAPMHQVKGVFEVNLLAQIAGVAALEDHAFVEKSVAINRLGLRFLYRELDRLGLNYVESHTNFVLVEIGPRAEAVQKRLLERGIIVRPCVNYDLPGFLRISVGTQAQNARLIKMLEEVLEPG